MPISGRELSLERKRLVEVLKLLDDKLTEAGNVIFKDEEKLLEFKKYTWENMRSFDAQELRQATADTELEANKLLLKQDYFLKLYKIKAKPYFAFIVF